MSQQPDEVGGRYAKYVLVVLVIVYVFNFIDRQILVILQEAIKAAIMIQVAVAKNQSIEFGWIDV